jgi:hypothetical protein
LVEIYQPRLAVNGLSPPARGSCRVSYGVQQPAPSPGNFRSVMQGQRAFDALSDTAEAVRPIMASCKDQRSRGSGCEIRYAASGKKNAKKWHTTTGILTEVLAAFSKLQFFMPLNPIRAEATSVKEAKRDLRNVPLALSNTLPKRLWCTGADTKAPEQDFGAQAKTEKTNYVQQVFRIRTDKKKLSKLQFSKDCNIPARDPRSRTRGPKIFSNRSSYSASSTRNVKLSVY